jgi:uncharacterized protein YjbJ (UPF0337 family)
MDEDRVTGAGKNVAGKLEESVGRATGDAKSQTRGKIKQAGGSAQEAFGHVKDSAGEAATAVRKFSDSLEDWLRDYIETNPYTAAVIALGLGWLIGRSHRPF